ncbi:uncharacterized protein TNCV_4142681 [Trichonephila clavipes]|nr:uncharacterized protein TNCV_4142681 [Trichonephila clavipes]
MSSAALKSKVSKWKCGSSPLERVTSPSCWRWKKKRTVQKSEAEMTSLDEKINILEVDFVFPKKTSKNVPVNEMEQLTTTNAFAALNTAKADDENVSPPKHKIKPIFMRIIDAYNLILQELHRYYPTATNTHMRGYIKIEAQSADDHRAVFLKLWGAPPWGGASISKIKD